MLSIAQDNLIGLYTLLRPVSWTFHGHYDLFRPKFPPTPSLWLFVPLQFFGVSLDRHRGRFLWFWKPPTPQYWGSVSTNRYIPHNLLRHITYLSYGQTLVQKTKQKQYKVDKLTLLLIILFKRYKGQTTGYWAQTLAFNCLECSAKTRISR